MSDLLRTIKAQADLYREWTNAAADPGRTLTRPQMAVYRMRSGGVELLKPTMIWLYDPELALPGKWPTRCCRCSSRGWFGGSCSG